MKKIEHNKIYCLGVGSLFDTDDIINLQSIYIEQQYHVVQMGTGKVGSDLGLGRRASWAMHVWCMGGAWRGVGYLYTIKIKITKTRMTKYKSSLSSSHEEGPNGPPSTTTSVTLPSVTLSSPQIFPVMFMLLIFCPVMHLITSCFSNTNQTKL